MAQAGFSPVLTSASAGQRKLQTPKYSKKNILWVAYQTKPSVIEYVSA